LGLQDLETLLQGLPQGLDRMQRRALGRQPYQDDVLWALDTLRHLRWGLVEEDAMETLGRGLTPRTETATAAVGSKVGHLPPAGLARRGFHGGREPVRFIQGRDDLPWLHARARQPPVAGQVQAQAPCIVAADPHGLLGGLPP
jgi:hypothetical protein